MKSGVSVLRAEDERPGRNAEPSTGAGTVGETGGTNAASAGLQESPRLAEVPGAGLGWPSCSSPQHVSAAADTE